jgi:uncharacterized protein YjbI with pentapeptide repeats
MMANEDHLKTLQQGVEAWNAWRKREPLITPDLGGATLPEHLVEVNLSGANLIRADLRTAELIKAILGGTDLRWAELDSANLLDANLIRADLRYADLT